MSADQRNNTLYLKIKRVRTIFLATFPFILTFSTNFKGWDFDARASFFGVLKRCFISIKCVNYFFFLKIHFLAIFRAFSIIFFIKLTKILAINKRFLANCRWLIINYIARQAISSLKILS